MGRELDSHDLARRLDTQLEFTHAEWAAFVITYPVWDDGDSTESEGLHIDDFGCRAPGPIGPQALSGPRPYRGPGPIAAIGPRALPVSSPGPYWAPGPIGPGPIRVLYWAPRAR